jgi:hypothetical protein
MRQGSGPARLTPHTCGPQLFYIARGINNLQHLPYNSMRMANLVIRLQVGRAAGPARSL